MKKKPDSLIQLQEKYSAYLSAIEDLRKHCLKHEMEVAIPLPGSDSRVHLLLKSTQRLERRGYQTGDWVPSNVMMGIEREN